MFLIALISSYVSAWVARVGIGFKETLVAVIPNGNEEDNVPGNTRRVRRFEQVNFRFDCWKEDRERSRFIWHEHNRKEHGKLFRASDGTTHKGGGNDVATKQIATGARLWG